MSRRDSIIFGAGFLLLLLVALAFTLAPAFLFTTSRPAGEKKNQATAHRTASAVCRDPLPPSASHDAGFHQPGGSFVSMGAGNQARESNKALTCRPTLPLGCNLSA